MTHRALATAAGTALLLAVTCLPAPVAAGPEPAAPAGPATDRELTNLDHLDWLGDTVTPPDQPRHTTYRLGEQPAIGVLWTYADRADDGSYHRLGGGTYDPDTDTYGQGAFNADDLARAAVVYLRHWQATGDPASREHAYELLRSVTYLQTISGPNAGNVVLWMQPDGTLNPSADPVELPNPSDSDASYWLARTVWALGEGYAAFRGEDARFAAFLRRRLELAVDALDRQVLDRYGDHLDIDGTATPAWLIADGADATAEAVLGLSAYVEAGGGSAQAHRALRRFGAGVAALSEGDARTWPFGAVRPWALSRSVWHAWGSQMPAALAVASVALGRPGLARGSTLDSFTFGPWLLTSGGPDNGRQPTRSDGTQIAYGVDSRLQSLLATADVTTVSTGRAAALHLAGIVAAWYSGANAAGRPMYDRATGRTYDGIAGDGRINRNSGAESTIHGLLSMLALDAHPRVAALARTDGIERRVGTWTLEAEDATLSADTTVVTPGSLWTDEASYGGTGYVALGSGDSATFTMPRHPDSLLLPVVDLRPGSHAVTRFVAGPRELGRVRSGGIGGQGDSPTPGALLPVSLPRTLSGGAGALTATTSAPGPGSARLDAVLLQPLVSRLVLRGAGHSTALLASASTRAERPRVQMSGDGAVRVTAYDGRGRLVQVRRATASVVRVTVPAGGFALVRR